MMTDVNNDFFEDDEPVEKVIAAFERGKKRLTGTGSRGQTAYLSVPGNVEPASGNEPLGELAAR